MEKKCDVIDYGRSADEPSNIVSNFLKPVKAFGGAIKKSIALSLT